MLWADQDKQEIQWKKSWFVYSGLSFWSAEQVDKLTLKCLVHMLAQNLFWVVLKILSGSIFFENNPIFLSPLKSEILQNKLAHFSTLIKTHCYSITSKEWVLSSLVFQSMDVSIDGRRTLFQFFYIWNL